MIENARSQCLVFPDTLRRHTESVHRQLLAKALEPCARVFNHLALQHDAFAPEEIFQNALQLAHEAKLANDNKAVWLKRPVKLRKDEFVAFCLSHMQDYGDAQPAETHGSFQKAVEDLFDQFDPNEECQIDEADFRELCEAAQEECRTLQNRLDSCEVTRVEKVAIMARKCSPRTSTLRRSKTRTWKDTEWGILYCGRVNGLLDAILEAKGGCEVMIEAFNW